MTTQPFTGPRFAALAIVLWPMTVMADIEIRRWNPPGLSQPDGYSQLVTVTGQGNWFYWAARRAFARTAVSRPRFPSSRS